jgi:flagellar protein FlgJ
MDRQVAMTLARSGGFGFAKLLELELAPRDGVGPIPPVTPRAPPPPPAPAPATAAFPQGLPTSLATLGGAEPVAVPTDPTPAQFVTALLPEANAAANALGVEPRLLLAQAALETGWGRAVPQRGDASGHNLFGIKAGESWSGAAAEHWTLEHAAGVTAPQRERFRAYGSAAESFADYVDLIATSRRYAGALEHAANPEAYARAVTKAGYATDPQYADKWLAIYHGDRLEQALRGIDLPPAP